MSEKKDFMIDVVKERTYQNQSRTYNEEYSKWRSDEKNPYAYNFVHDTREHSYVDGEGYLNRKADVAERIALYKCLGLLGLTMFVMLAIDMMSYFVVKNLYVGCSGNIIYRSQKYTDPVQIPVSGGVLICVFNLAKYLIPAFIFKSVTNIPTKVVFPISGKNNKVINSAIIISLVVMVLGRMGSYLISQVLGVFNIDSVYTYMVHSNDFTIILISVLANCIAIPIACEFFYRGVVMQTFRQFGDSYAILISCIAYGFSFYDLSYMGYAVCFSIVVGLFTIRTGSLLTAIFMNISASLTNYTLSFLAMQHSSEGEISEAVICTIIIAGAIIAYSRLTSRGNWSFNISADDSQMTFSKKIKVMLSTNTVAMWLVASIIMTFICMRIL